MSGVRQSPATPQRGEDGASSRPRPVVLLGVRLGPGGPVVDVRVAGGRVVDIGETVAGETGDEVVHWRGGVLLPGFVDGHVHSTQWASRRRRIDVHDAHSPREVVDALLADVRSRPTPPRHDEVIMGHGFRDALWSDVPHKDLLEAALPGQPVAVVSQDLHSIWLSPSALALAGRDDATGVLREKDCIDAKYALGRLQSAETLDRAVAEATYLAASRGVTEIIDFEFADNRADWLRRISGRRVGVRVRSSVWPPWLEEAIELGMRTGESVAGSQGQLEVGPFKLVADGSLNTRTAYCHDPYPEASSAEELYGMLLLREDELVELMTRAYRNGLHPAVHAIGDHANTIALNAFDRVACPGRIEHAQLVRPQDVPRFARPGLVASVQPQHAVADRDVADRFWSGRTASAFPYGDLHRAGARLELGSDAPVSEPDPWLAIAAATTRTDDDRPPWHPEQAIPLATALTAASAGRGAVRVGDRADLTVVALDPTTVTPHDLAQMPVRATLLGGELTFRSED